MSAPDVRDYQIELERRCESGLVCTIEIAHREGEMVAAPTPSKSDCHPVQPALAIRAWDGGNNALAYGVGATEYAAQHRFGSDLRSKACPRSVPTLPTPAPESCRMAAPRRTVTCSAVFTAEYARRATDTRSTDRIMEFGGLALPACRSMSVRRWPTWPPSALLPWRPAFARGT